MAKCRHRLPFYLNNLNCDTIEEESDEEDNPAEEDLPQSSSEDEDTPTQNTVCGLPSLSHAAVQSHLPQQIAVHEQQVWSPISSSALDRSLGPQLFSISDCEPPDPLTLQRITRGTAKNLSNVRFFQL